MSNGHVLPRRELEHVDLIRIAPIERERRRHERDPQCRQADTVGMNAIPLKKVVNRFDRAVDQPKPIQIEAAQPAVAL